MKPLKKQRTKNVYAWVLPAILNAISTRGSYKLILRNLLCHMGLLDKNDDLLQKRYRIDMIQYHDKSHVHVVQKLAVSLTGNKNAV